MIRLVGKRGKGSFESQLDDAAKGMEFEQIDCTSGNKDEVMRGLSPFYLGPVECYDGLVSQTFERAWQCSKVFAGFADSSGNPLPEWFAWRDRMWADASNEDHMAIRFPAGRENANAKKTLYSYWKVDGEFKRLGYIDARKHIYLPVYAKAVVKTEAYRRLCAMRDEGRNLLLVDFDGYNIHHPKYGFTYNDAIHCPLLKMGHGFVLAMLLEGVIKIDEGGNVIYADGLMDDPHKVYSTDLRKLTDEQKLDRAASCAGVTANEFRALPDADRKMLKRAYSREACKARGIARAAWARLPLAEKLRVAQLEEQRHEPVSVLKEAAEPENDAPEVADSDLARPSELARPSDLAGYFNAGSLADATGTIPGWAATDRPDIVRLWVPKTVLSIGSFAFKGCANLEEIVFEALPDGADQSIGTMAFAGCPKLGKVLLSGSVRSIGAGAFRDDGALTTLQVDPSWKGIQVGPHAFDNCPAPDELQKQIASAKVNAKNKPVPLKPTAQEEISTSVEFVAFWSEFVGWWGMDEDSNEEALTLKNGKAEYALKCCWDEGTLLVAMVAPWPEEWDYVQLYRGMFGCGDVGKGFHSRALRKKVVRLLLAEIIRRKKWLQKNPGTADQRDHELREERAKSKEAIRKIANDIESLEGKRFELSEEDYYKERIRLKESLDGAKREYYDMASHQWFAKYRWTRNKMARPGEGDMRLYVKGCNRLFGTPIHCQWALSDMRRKSKGSSGRRQADSSRGAEKSAAEEGADSCPLPRSDIFFGEV